jgi:hypothetical protein
MPLGSYSAGVTFMKVAAFFTTYDGALYDLTRVPDVDFFIEDTCPSGGGTVRRPVEISSSTMEIVRPPRALRMHDVRRGACPGEV